MADRGALFDYLLRLGDNALVASHRLSEWCGHGPALEEDIAMANTALDLIGQAQLWLGLAGEVEGAGRTADDLAMLRDAWDFRNVLLVEQPNSDLAVALMRQFLFDTLHLAVLRRLVESAEPRIAAIAEKAVKEVTYHAERSTDTVVALGDGTAESHRRMQAALDRLWPFAGEMVEADDLDRAMQAAGIGPDLDAVREEARARLVEVLERATLRPPESDFVQLGGKSGARHTEHLGHMLAQMQWLQRAYPGATW